MKTRLSLALLLACTLPTIAVGQQRQDDDQRPAPPQTEGQDPTQLERREANFRGPGRTQQRPDQQEDLTAYLAAKLQLANLSEIQLATLATQQAEHPEVKQFAEMLVRSHRQLNQQISQAVPGLPAAGVQQRGENQPRSSEARRSQDENIRRSQDENARQSQTADRQQSPRLTGAHQELIAINRRAVDNAVQMTSEMFRDKEGTKFDMCFVTQQIGAHVWLLSELQAIRDAGPQEFSQVVQQAEQETQQHLEQAKELAKKLEQQLTGSQDQGRASRQQSTQRDSIE